MSLIDMCRSSLKVPLSEHKDWRASLIVFQGACLCCYLASTFIHRKRLFCLPIFRKWDLDHVFMALSTAAAATGVVTWVFWMETNLANVRAQIANEMNDPQAFARQKGSAWKANAVYLIFKPISIALYALPPHEVQP